jgi:hypothetical protein
MNAHVDYSGRCEYHINSALMEDNEMGSSFNDGRCEMVYENGRCSPVKCQSTVLPPGSCCPMCGEWQFYRCRNSTFLSRKRLKWWWGQYWLMVTGRGVEDGGRYGEGYAADDDDNRRWWYSDCSPYGKTRLLMWLCGKLERCFLYFIRMNLT